MKRDLMHRSAHGAGILFVCCLALAHVLSLTGSADAGTIDEAQSAYAEGRFTEAARIGEALGTSRGLALAAKSLTVHGVYNVREGERQSLFERAVKLARLAIRTDSGNADAHLQLARAIGRLAQEIGSAEAMDRGYPKEIRAASENALRLDPEMASAHISLGRWHAGVVDAAGSFLARITFGAREKHAIASLQRGLELAPDSKSVMLGYAVGLLTLDEDEHREEVRDLLKRAIEIPARDAYDRLLHERVIDRLKTVQADGR